MLKKIIEYQNTESKIIAKENELLRSKDREKASEIQKALKSQHSKLIELDNLAQKTNQVYLKAVEKYNQFSKKLEELEKQVDGGDKNKTSLAKRMVAELLEGSHIHQRWPSHIKILLLLQMR